MLRRSHPMASYSNSRRQTFTKGQLIAAMVIGALFMLALVVPFL